MGCLSSRSTIAPSSSSSNSNKSSNKGATKSKRPILENAINQQQETMNDGGAAASGEQTRITSGGSGDLMRDKSTMRSIRQHTIGYSETTGPDPDSNNKGLGLVENERNLKVLNDLQHSLGSSMEPEDDIMSILMGNQESYITELEETKQTDKDSTNNNNNINNNNSKNSFIDTGNSNNNNNNNNNNNSSNMDQTKRNFENEGARGEGKKQAQLNDQNRSSAVEDLEGVDAQEQQQVGEEDEQEQEQENEEQQQQRQQLEQEQQQKQSGADGGGVGVGGNGEEMAAAGEDEQSMELLRQYVAVEYEIGQLEDKDALRVYHEKIEQLEQLERELDMISSEAEKVASRSDAEERLERHQSMSIPGSPNIDHQQKMSGMDTENNSIVSGATGTVSRKSWLASTTTNSNITTTTTKGRQKFDNSNNNNKQRTNNNNNNNSGSKQRDQNNKSADSSAITTIRNTLDDDGRRLFGKGSSMNGLSYSTVEEVFNRKIILEKERDRLKKEVEFVIVECDKLQQRYKKRDEILDKIFDGRTGNGLENHLEQQLDWLLEQKHYVDQVFYAWKRAETLTSETCEQFATALEQLKRLPKEEEPAKRAELARSIGGLLIKSRENMEQAQKYNPNVDAPFFTDKETERFDKIIETISMTSISPSEYSQVLTVIQFAYKRAVSIRLWLEQILQTTIARDSFELAEEYKWIAIQLRKERINLIKSKLQEPPYVTMVQTVQEQMRRRQLSHERRQQHEINRDSGVESETNDMDIEEEIYRLLELNKSRLEASAGAISGRENQLLMNQQQVFDHNKQVRGGANQAQAQFDSTNNNNNNSMNEGSIYNRDDLLRHRIQRRVDGDLPLHLSQVPANSTMASSGDPQMNQFYGFSNRNSAHASEISINNSSIGTSATPTKLKVELDEEARQSLLKQVDQIHNRHRTRMERLRGSNRAKATSSVLNRIMQARQQQQQQQQADNSQTIQEPPMVAGTQAAAGKGGAGASDSNVRYEDQEQRRKSSGSKETTLR